MTNVQLYAVAILAYKGDSDYMHTMTQELRAHTVWATTHSDAFSKATDYASRMFPEWKYLVDVSIIPER